MGGKGGDRSREAAVEAVGGAGEGGGVWQRSGAFGQVRGADNSYQTLKITERRATFDGKAIWC